MLGIEQCRCYGRCSRPFDQLYVCDRLAIAFLFCLPLDAPEFKSFPSAYTLARLGDALTLSCQIDSNPPANILWTRNGEFVGGGAQYQIPDVREEDYAVYACIATLGGQFTKIFASTKIVPPGRFHLFRYSSTRHCAGPPRFYPPQPVLASKRSEVMLQCQLERDTEPLVGPP